MAIRTLSTNEINTAKYNAEVTELVSIMPKLPNWRICRKRW